MSLELRTNLRGWSNDIDFLLIQKVHGERPAVAEPIRMRIPKPEEDVVAMQPTFSLDRTQAQALMDRLWTCGLRPSEGTGSAGSLAATQKHLEDMRAIALHKLGMEKKTG